MVFYGERWMFDRRIVALAAQVLSNTLQNPTISTGLVRHSVALLGYFLRCGYWWISRAWVGGMDERRKCANIVNRVLDRDHLARYTLGDAALEREVLDLFVGQLPQTLAALQTSADPCAWKLAAHTLKGSARAVGAWQLADAAERAEDLATDPDRWGQVTDDIETAVRSVRATILRVHDVALAQ